MPQSPPIRRAEALGMDVEFRVIRNLGWVMAPHWHSDLQVIATSSGLAEVIVGDDAPVRLPPGALIVIPPESPHTAYATGSAAWTFHSLHMSPDRLEGSALGLTTPVVSGPGDPLAASFSLLVDSLFSKSSPSLADRHSAFSSQLVRVIGLSERRRGPHPEMRAVADELDRDLEGTKSVSAIAERHGMSAGHLSREFRRACGMPPHAWRINARVEAAKRYLRAGQSVGRAAELAGFRDSGHLARQCKLATGLTPRAYRRRASVAQSEP